MKLYINKDIAADSDKVVYWMSGDDATSYSDIASFLDYMREYAPEDNRIDIEIHSCGGDCIEGYAIYDALRASGKEIHACVVGTCASMASVILLAAPYENRTMYEHARMLIHEPYYPNGLSGEMTISRLEGVQEALRTETAKMLHVYAERTGIDEEVLAAQMSDGSWFGTEKALELRFISSVVPAMSAKAGEPIISTTKPQTQEMKVKNEGALAKAFVALGKAMGVVEDDTPSAMTLTDVTGVEIEIDREEGEPQVGDTTSAADGEYTLEDGRTLVVQDGTITEIKTENPEPEEEPAAEENETDEDDGKDEKIAELEEQIEELKQQLEEAKQSGKTDDEEAILAFVKEHGGLSALKRKAVGNFKEVRRTGKETRLPEDEMKAHYDKRLEEVKAAQDAKRKK